MTFRPAFAVFLIFLAAPARADTIEVCREVIKRIFVPAEGHTEHVCLDPGATWLIHPWCALPGLCKLDPFCSVAEYVQTSDGYFTEEVAIECDTSEEGFIRDVTRSARAQLPGFDDSNFPGPKEVFRRQIEAGWTRGTAIPQAVQEFINLEVIRLRPGSPPIFDKRHVGQMRMLSNKDPILGWIVKDQYATTIANLVIFRDEIFQRLINLKMPPSWLSLSNSEGDFCAVSTLVHELVHVRQYDEIGINAFIYNYLGQLGKAGGNEVDGEYEREAYGFENQFALNAPGDGGTRCNKISSFSGPLLACAAGDKSKLAGCAKRLEPQLRAAMEKAAAARLAEPVPVPVRTNEGKLVLFVPLAESVKKELKAKALADRKKVLASRGVTPLRAGPVLRPVPDAGTPLRPTPLRTSPLLRRDGPVPPGPH